MKKKERTYVGGGEENRGIQEVGRAETGRYSKVGGWGDGEGRRGH